jgi:hypothetical protein
MQQSSKLIYNFPIKAPFVVMHFNTYAAGRNASFEGSDCYLIGCCSMTSFACMEPVTSPYATNFASAIMKILSDMDSVILLYWRKIPSSSALAARL